MSDLSNAAALAQLKGVNAMCPGCKIERKVPTNRDGAALHFMGKNERGSYECHASSEAWKDVPEFKEQPNG